MQEINMEIKEKYNIKIKIFAIVWVNGNWLPRGGGGA
jgi:hypothetical protein